MKLIISLVTRFIPRHYLHRVSHFFLSLISIFYRGSKFEDPINGKTYRKLLPYGRIDSRKNALAPNSMSLERHRLLWIYLKEKTNFFTDDLRFLHIAPEYCFIKRFKKMKNLDYVTGDLISPWADVKMDIQKIPFEANEFDVIMCNHVLEHVDDDKKAMQEFHRVMKPGGWGIFQVPIDNTREETYEDRSITDPKEREKHFWQADHLRLYGKDYGKILTQAGFDVVEDDLINQMDPALVKRYALPKNATSSSACTFSKSASFKVKVFPLVVTIIKSGSKVLKRLVSKPLNPFITDRVTISAAVTVATPTTLTPEIILITFVDFLENKYLFAM